MNKEQIKAAREALSSLDDYARMNTGVDAIGPRGVLERFISEAERTTAPVSLTDEGIIECAAEIFDFKPHKQGEEQKAKWITFARALLAAAPAPIQKEPVLWVESEPSIRDKDARYAINSLCHTVAYHMKKPDTTNPVWPLYAATPARVDAVGGDAVETREQIRDRLSRKVLSMPDAPDVIGGAHAKDPIDPMDWPLPCDVKVGHGTHRKGCTLGSLVARMQVLYNMVQAGIKAPSEECMAAMLTNLDAAQKPNADCSGEPANCPDNEGYGCACDPMNKAAMREQP